MLPDDDSVMDVPVEIDTTPLPVDPAPLAIVIAPLLPVDAMDCTATVPLLESVTLVLPPDETRTFPPPSTEFPPTTMTSPACDASLSPLRSDTVPLVAVADVPVPMTTSPLAESPAAVDTEMLPLDKAPVPDVSLMLPPAATSCEDASPALTTTVPPADPDPASSNTDPASPTMASPVDKCISPEFAAVLVPVESTMLPLSAIAADVNMSTLPLTPASPLPSPLRTVADPPTPKAAPAANVKEPPAADDCPDLPTATTTSPL